MKRPGLFRLIIKLWFVLDLSDAFSATVTTKRPFLQTVTDWLDGENIVWRLHQRQDAKNVLFPRTMTNQPVLEVMGAASNLSSSSDASVLCYLHILKSPNATSDCVSPICTRDMTNYVQCINHACSNASKLSLIHLHQDVWHSKTDIVQNRLLNRFGHSGPSRSRVYARKTVARRIDAGTAIPFLQEHHLWSATKARYYYGLFLPASKVIDQKDVLVAVATFSTKRKILRGSQVTRSHELIRFCTRSNGVVVGGITKLIRAFINDQEPVDDIVTVVDRDWGPGDGWHSIGFETLHVMAPVVMVVKDGVRRHMVGAGIKNDVQPGTTSKTKQESVGRPGVESSVLEELSHIATHQEALQSLEKHEYYPVYDAGVERLLMTVHKEQSGGVGSKLLTLASTVPSYAASYNSNNSGISALLGNIMAVTASSMYGRALSDTTTILSKAGVTKVHDSIAAQSHTAEWMATRGSARDATLLYTAPSSLDPHAHVEVRERPRGWCTLGIAGGSTKSIYHGNFKLVDGDTHGIRSVDSSALINEYLRSMAAVALAGLEYQKSHPDSADGENSNNDKSNLSFLYLGYGAGSLPRFMASTIAGSRHVAIELDEGVVSAAHDCNLLSHSLSSSDAGQVQLLLGDALAYGRSIASSNTDGNMRNKHNDPFDVVFVDIFDGDNLLPKDFYSKSHLEHIYQNHLGGRPDGMVIHNFHTGGKKRASQFQDAVEAYRSIFSTTLAVESIDSRSTGGNAILLATNKRRLDASSETTSWSIAGRRAQQLWGIDFDVFARTTHKLWLS